MVFDRFISCFARTDDRPETKTVHKKPNEYTKHNTHTYNKKPLKESTGGERRVDII